MTDGSRKIKVLYFTDAYVHVARDRKTLFNLNFLYFDDAFIVSRRHGVPSPIGPVSSRIVFSKSM